MRRGLTLVEVLVIVVVLVVAVALLLPNIICARGAARRITCMNNQKMLALAMLEFESKQRQFPGFKQPLASQEVSWTVILLPHLVETDLWQKWKRGVPEKRPMGLMICPSDLPGSMGATDGPSSYAVNTKICMDGKGLSLKYIASKDGTATTLLLSENLRADKAHNWWDTDPVTIGLTDGLMKDNVGSNHSNGIQAGIEAALCDNQVRFFRNDMDDDLFKALVTPDGGESVDEDKF